MLTLETVPELNEEKTIENALVGFIHIEQKDEADPGYAETKLIKNLKWAARKNETNSIVLHSFTHLSESKGSPETTKKIFDSAEARLKTAGYETCQTPFGYFLDLNIESKGTPLTRLFVEC